MLLSFAVLVVVSCMLFVVGCWLKPTSDFRSPTSERFASAFILLPFALSLSPQTSNGRRPSLSSIVHRPSLLTQFIASNLKQSAPPTAAGSPSQRPTIINLNSTGHPDILNGASQPPNFHLQCFSALKPSGLPAFFFHLSTDSL